MTTTYTNSPTITSKGTAAGYITLHNFRPDEAHSHPTIYLNNLNLQSSGGCYTSTCAAVGGDGVDAQILDNAHVIAACKGSLGTGIGGDKTADSFGGNGESFKTDGNSIVNATGAQYGPNIGGGAQQKTCCGTHPGNSGSCNVRGYSNVTAQSGGKADNFGIGGHTGGWANYNGSYTNPMVDPTATFNH